MFDRTSDGVLQKAVKKEKGINVTGQVHTELFKCCWYRIINDMWRCQESQLDIFYCYLNWKNKIGLPGRWKIRNNPDENVS